MPNYYYLRSVKQLFVIVILTLLFLNSHATSFSTIVESGVFVLDMRQGLSESRVRQIKQMADGRIAIATTATIDIFDGTRFTSYKLQPEDAYPLPDYQGYRQLTCDKSGLIWLRNKRILYVLDSKRGTVIHNVDSLLKKKHLKASEIAAWPIEHDPDAFSLSANGKEHGKVIKNVTCVERDRNGGLWIGTKENGILYENAKRGRQFHTFPDSTFKFSRLQNFYSPRTSQLSAKFAASATNCSLDRTKGDYAWIGTRQGIMVFDKEDKLVATIDSRDGLSTDNIQSLIKDKNGDIWAATANGISRIHIAGKDSFDITNYGELDGIDVGGHEFRTCQIHRDSKGLITVGFAGGIVTFNPDSIARPYYIYHYPRPDKDIEEKASSSYYWKVIPLPILIMFAILFWNWKRRNRKTDKSHDVNDLPKTSTGTINRLKAPSSEEKADQVFLNRLQEIIEANISDENFSVQNLSEQMAMDRTGLYRRTLALTGLSPSNYIRKVRMEAAARLLKETALPVADIATRTGFSTTKYFNKVFREIFGIVPAKYREEGSESHQPLTSNHS